jgi:hypothetical protein
VDENQLGGSDGVPFAALIKREGVSPSYCASASKRDPAPRVIKGLIPPVNPGFGGVPIGAGRDPP